jgi:hypothetical protein
MSGQSLVKGVGEQTFVVDLTVAIHIGLTDHLIDF